MSKLFDNWPDDPAENAALPECLKALADEIGADVTKSRRELMERLGVHSRKEAALLFKIMEREARQQPARARS